MLRRTGGLNRQKRGCRLPEMYTHTKKTSSHTPPSSLSWPLRLLYVWHAVCFKDRTTRHNTVCLGNSLPLHHSLVLCTSLSALLVCSLTPFPNSDSMETQTELLLAQPPTKATPSLSLSLSTSRSQQAGETATPHAQKWSIFNFPTLFHVVSEKDVSKQEPWGGHRGEEEGAVAVEGSVVEECK